MAINVLLSLAWLGKGKGLSAFPRPSVLGLSSMPKEVSPPRYNIRGVITIVWIRIYMKASETNLIILHQNGHKNEFLLRKIKIFIVSKG